MLLDRACRLVGLLINTSRTGRRDEIFVASGIEHVEVVLAQLAAGDEGREELESYASFVQRGADTVGQVTFTFDRDQRLLEVSRGVRMWRVELRTAEHLVRAAGLGGMGC